jgi:hypothetical protein
MAFREIRDPNVRTAIISSLLGATVEWYDCQRWLICAYVPFAGVLSAVCSLPIRPFQPQKLSV